MGQFFQSTRHHSYIFDARHVAEIHFVSVRSFAHFFFVHVVVPSSDNF